MIEYAYIQAQTHMDTHTHVQAHTFFSASLWASEERQRMNKNWGKQA